MLDTYIGLVHISSELNNKFIIQTYHDSISYLTNLVRKYVNTTYKTIRNCINKLIDSKILIYDNTLEAWIIEGMSNMVKSKKNVLNEDEAILCTGYTKIRPFFLTDEFHAMRSMEKRLLIFMAQKSDSKFSNKFKNFVVNLNRRNSGWYKILRTTDKYYAKKTIQKMFDKYKNIITPLVNEDSESLNYYTRKSKLFTIEFICPMIAGKNEKAALEDESIKTVITKNPEEYRLIETKATFLEIILDKKQTMHIIRAISNIKEWFLKERIVQLLLNKIRSIQIHKNSNTIKSLPAYAAAVVKNTINEYKQFLSNKLVKNYCAYELEMDYYDYINSLNDKIVNNNIRTTQKLFS